MHSAARQPAEDPVPEPAELQARVAAVCAEHQAVIDDIRAMRRSLAVSACDPQAIAVLSERLRDIAASVFDAGVHAEEMRGEMARYAAVRSADSYRWDDGYETGHADGWKDCETALRAAPKIPAPRHRRTSASRQPADGQVALFSVKSAIPVAAAFWAAAKGAVNAHRIAAALTAVTLPAAAGAGAYVTLAPGITQAAGGDRGHGAGPAASVSATAAPIPSPSLAGDVRHARPGSKHHGPGRALLSAGGARVPAYGPVPVPSSPDPSSNPPSASVQAGPAVLTVSTSSLDLSGDITSVTVTVTATGGGWASWHITTAGTDLTFIPDHGVLQAGQQAVITVSRASVLDALRVQSFTVAGQVVTVSLPLPDPVASVLPAASDLPTVLPSVPDPSGS